MNWIICFSLSLVLLIGAFVVIVAKKRGSNRLVLAMGLLLAAAYIIYVPQYFGIYDFETAFLGGFINLLQIISLDADFLSFYEFVRAELGKGFFARIFFALMAIIHLAIPAVSAMTAVTIVVNWLARLRMGFIKNKKNNLYVFSEFNSDTYIFAKDIRKTDPKGELLFLDKAGLDETADIRKKLHCSVIPENISDFDIQAQKRKVYMYCMSQQDSDNLNSFLDIIARLAEKTPEEQQNIHVFLASRDPSAELIIDSLTKGLVNTTLINEERMAVYSLLEEYPLLKYAKDKKISVLICGFSKTADEMLRAVSWCGQLYGYTLSVKLAAKNIGEKENDFRAKYPGLFTDRYDIKFYDYKNELEFSSLLNNEFSESNYIVVAEDDEVMTVERSVMLRRAFYSLDPEYTNCPPIFSYVPDDEKAAAVSILKTPEIKPQRRVDYNIIPFGVASDIYTFSFLTDSRVEQLAKNIHLVYEDIFSDGGIDPIAALRGYHTFEVNKNASESNAVHIRYKLLMLGMDYTEDENAQEVDFNSRLDPDALEKLSFAEHNRWMAFLESEGWTEATVEQVNSYKASDLSRGRHNCPILKVHPYICGFYDLPGVSEQLGLPDAMEYDVQLIARIPDILHDKWNVTGKKYKIINIE